MSRFRLPVSRLPRRARRGSALYMTVLGTALIVSLLGLAGLTVARVERQRSTVQSDLVDATSLSRSAVELALLRLSKNTNWRTTYTNNVETAPEAFHGGTISFKLVDSDGSLSDDLNDVVTVHGIGRYRGTTWVTTVEATNGADPIEVVTKAATAQGQITIQSSKNLNAVGAPGMSNTSIFNQGTFTGNAEAVAFSGSGAYLGTTTIKPAIPIPPATVIDDYIALATSLPYTGSLEAKVLTPGFNSYGGGLNPDGVYYINTSGLGDLIIKGARIHGTLIIDVGNLRAVHLVDHAFMKNHRADYPVLMVRAKTLIIQLKSLQEPTLTELQYATNFNPPGAPYQGMTDSDTLDAYPNELQGLIYTNAEVRFLQTPKIVGTLITEKTIEVTNSVTFQHDAGLLSNPPIGFQKVSAVINIRSNTWRRAAYP